MPGDARQERKREYSFEQSRLEIPYLMIRSKDRGYRSGAILLAMLLFSGMLAVWT